MTPVCNVNYVSSKEVQDTYKSDFGQDRAQFLKRVYSFNVYNTSLQKTKVVLVYKFVTLREGL